MPNFAPSPHRSSDQIRSRCESLHPQTSRLQDERHPMTRALRPHSRSRGTLSLAGTIATGNPPRQALSPIPADNIRVSSCCVRYKRCKIAGAGKISLRIPAATTVSTLETERVGLQWRFCFPCFLLFQDDSASDGEALAPKKDSDW